MIWWLVTKIWWALPLAVAVSLLVAVALVGRTIVAEFAKRVPAWLWQAAGVAVLLSYASDYLIGVGVERCEAAQEAAQAKQVSKGQEASKRAQGAATAVKRDIAKVSQSEQAEVREIVRYLPATCPEQPSRLREIGQRAVERTRASLPAAEDS